MLSKMKPWRELILLVLFIFLIPQLSRPQSIDSRLTTSVYIWEGQSTDSTSQQYIRAYQLVRINLKGLGVEKLSFHTYFKATNDFSSDLPEDSNLRLMNAYARYRFSPGVKLSMGRQRIFSGVTTMAIDGARFEYSGLRKLKVDGYWGSNVPSDRSLKVLEIRGNQVFGWRVRYLDLIGTDFSLSYSDVRQEVGEYEVPGRFTERRIERQATKEQLLGFEVRRGFFNKVNLYARAVADYGIQGIGLKSGGLRRWQRIDVIGRYFPFGGLMLTSEYVFRQPRVAMNTIFWVFEQESNSEIWLRFSYRLTDNLTLSGGNAQVKYASSESANRLNIVADWRGIGVSFGNRSGYAGKSTAASLFYNRSIMSKGLLRLNVSRYSFKINPDSDEENDAISGSLGINWRVTQGLSVDGDLQYLSQDIKSQKSFFGYANDLRLFARANYRFSRKR